MTERRRAALGKVRHLYRGFDGALWGLPKLPRGVTPVDRVVRVPLDQRSWLQKELSWTTDYALKWAKEYDRLDDIAEIELAARLSATVLALAPSGVVQKAFAELAGSELLKRVPEFDERIPRNWIQISDRGDSVSMGDGDRFRAMFEFLQRVRSLGVEIPKEPGTWVDLPEHAAGST